MWWAFLQSNTGHPMHTRAWKGRSASKNGQF
jgi:hypothetical protein